MRPVEIALQLVELLGVHQPAGVTELARLAGLPKSTTQRSLAALQKAGWIELRDPDRAHWTLTMRAIVAAGSRATSDQQSLRSLAIPVMEELRRATEETVHLSFLFGNLIVLFERLDGIKPVRYFLQRGTVFSLHSTASGKAILAKLSPERFNEYTAHSLVAVTPHTVTSPAELKREMQVIRELGYAVTLGGNVSDVHAIGAAICDPIDRPFAALSVSAPAGRLTPDLIARWGPAVADAARRVSVGAAALPDFRGASET